MRVPLGCTAANSVGTPVWVNVGETDAGTAGEAAAKTAGTPGADVDGEVQAVIAVSIAIEATNTRDRFIFILEKTRTDLS